MPYFALTSQHPRECKSEQSNQLQMRRYLFHILTYSSLALKGANNYHSDGSLTLLIIFRNLLYISCTIQNVIYLINRYLLLDFAAFIRFVQILQIFVQ